MTIFLALIFIPIIYFIVSKAAEDGTKKSLEEFHEI